MNFDVASRWLCTRLTIAIGLLVLSELGASAEDNPGRLQASVTDDQQHVEFSNGRQILLKYAAADGSRKQYVQELRTPNGVAILSDAPPDHPWHHGMMLAMTVDGVNYWEEPRAGQAAALRLGHQQIASPLLANRSESNGSSFVTVANNIDWCDDQGHTQLSERRAIALAEKPRTADLLLTWRSELKIAGDASSVSITGAHYDGLGLRFAPQFTDNVKVVLPEGLDPSQVGHPFRGSEVLYDTPWCAYQASLSSGELTIAMFAAPKSVNRPTRWFTMYKPFTYLSATLALNEQPLRLASGERLILTYGLAAWDSHVDAQQISRAFDEWQAQLEILPE